MEYKIIKCKKKKNMKLNIGSEKNYLVNNYDFWRLKKI